MYAATQPIQPEQEGAAESDEEEENEEPGPSQVCIFLGSLGVAKNCVNRSPSQAAMCAILSPAQGSIAENSWSHRLCLLLEADSKQTFCLSCFGFWDKSLSLAVMYFQHKHARCSLQARAVCREEEPLADCKVANGHVMLTGAFLMEK